MNPETVKSFLVESSLNLRQAFGKPITTVLLLLPILLLATNQYWLFPASKLPSPRRDLKSNLLPISMNKQDVMRGQFPMDNPWYSGESNFSNPLWNFLYIPSTIFFLSLPLPVAIQVIILLHILLSWVFMSLLVWDFTENSLAATFSAFLYAFSGAWLTRLEAFHFEKIFGLTMLPLIFYLFKRLYDRPSKPAAWLLGITMAGFVYAGAMYLMVYLLIILGIVISVLLLQRALSKTHLQALGLAIFAFLILSSVKLAPNALFALDTERPSFFALPYQVLATTFILPGQLWLGVWRNMPSYFISTSGLLLAGYGFVALRKSQYKAYTLAFLAAFIMMLYWSLGVPPFALPEIMEKMRAADRALLPASALIAQFAGIGLNALLHRTRASKRIWALVVVGMTGFLFEIAYIWLRCYPGLTQSLTFLENYYNPRALEIWNKFLWVNRWDAVRGIGIALCALALYRIWARLNEVKFTVPGLLMWAMAFFAVTAGAASMQLKYEPDPLMDLDLLAIQAQTAGKVVAFSEFNDKGTRGRVALALAGHSHLLNPYYGVFGQKITPEVLNRLEYIVSPKPVTKTEAGFSIRLWSQRDRIISTIPECRLKLVGEYQTSNPLTWKDPRINRAEIPDLIELLTGPTQQTPLYLYQVGPQCSEGQESRGS